jgi:hypothetical protein
MEYLIGAGAFLETRGSITPAVLHANVDEALAAGVQAAVVDFEATKPEAMSRILVVAKGWNAARFRAAVTGELLARPECTLAEVLRVLARAAGTARIHLFAHYFPDEETVRTLREAGIEVLAHPLESIAAASVISGQRVTRYAA